MSKGERVFAEMSRCGTTTMHVPHVGKTSRLTAFAKGLRVAAEDESQTCLIINLHAKKMTWTFRRGDNRIGYSKYLLGLI